MAFAFGNAAAGGASASTTTTELQELDQENLGFLALKGDNKVKVFPNPWPSDSLPSPTSSLLSIASRRGLLAAAGPEVLVIASTESIRAAIQSDGSTIKDLSPQLSVPLPRLSQVAFTSDENYLIVSAQNGGGLKVYAVDALTKGDTTSSIEISTEGISVRALVPNPFPDNAHIAAVLLADGKLMLADLMTRAVVRGPNGPVLKDGVSCVSWSTRGKQLVAGTQDGLVFQLKPEPFGDVAAQIPRPPQVGSDHHVSTLLWLANDDFLIIYTPTNFEQDTNPDSLYYHVKRRKGTQNYSFNKFTGDPAGPFGLNRSPPHHFIQRLRDFKPHLDDVLIVASTASPDIGMLTKASSPLSSDHPVTNEYTTTMVPDGRTAALPTTLDEDKVMEAPDTSPIGVALDLSAKEKVLRPIPAELEYTESPTPLPAIMVLNNEGILSAWWVLYYDSIRAGTGYAGLVALSGDQSTPAPSQSTPAPVSAPVQASPFASSTSNAQATPFSAFAKPAAPAFGTPSQPTSGFFGGSTPGPKPSVWGASGTTAQTGGSAFGMPSFGQSSSVGGLAGGSAFGKAGGLGQASSPWGTPSAPNQASPSPAAPAASPFGKFAENKSSSPFGGMSGGGGFASLASQNKPGQSPFTTASGTSAFGTTPASSFGMKSNQSFGSTISIDSKAGESNKGTSTFSSWGQPSTANTPSQQQTSLFGGQQSSFASTAQESEMETVDEDRTRSEATPTPQTNPQTKTSPFGFGGEPFKLGSTFKGDGTAKDDLPKPAGGSSFLGDSFGKALEEKPTVPETPVKKEPGTEDTVNLKDISTTPALPSKPQASSLFGAFTPSQNSVAPKAALPEVASLPPDSTLPSQKPASRGDDAPLPPDFTLGIKSKQKDDAPLPPDFTLPSKPIPGDAPLPPDFISIPKPKPKDSDDLPPLAGSPPIAVEAPSSDLSESESSPIAPPADEGQPEVEGPSDEADEEISESDVDDDEPQPPVGETKPGWKFGPLSQQAPPFAPSPPTNGGRGSRSPSRSPSRFQPPKPATGTGLFGSTTPATLPKGPNFAPPHRGSPRSPSPIRSISQPVFGQQPPRHNPSPPLSIAHKPASRPASRLQAPPINAEPEPSIADLEDDEDVHIRAELEAPLTGTKVLDDFLPHVDYQGKVTKSGIPGHIELCYRDINSMLDTLGLNARAIASFVKGHNELLPENGRSRDDLDDIAYDEEGFEDWCLIEIEDLHVLENDMEQNLESGRIQNVAEKLSELATLNSITSRLRTRISALRRQILLSADKSSARDTVPLTSEQSFQQRNIRTAFAELQKYLAEAEEATLLLRSKVSSSRPGSSQGSSPTVEAITNTIQKITKVIEQKSGDLDVLEEEMQQLKLPGQDEVLDSIEVGEPISPDHRIPGAWREADRADTSPFATPPTRKSRSESVLSEHNTPQSASFTPRSVLAGAVEANGSPVPRRSLQSSVRRAATNGSTPSKNLMKVSTPVTATSRKEQFEREKEERLGVTEEVVRERMQKIARRRKVADKLATLLGEREIRVTSLGAQ